ncbi:hypothetical protein THRCLA_02202 [Thraustotheca clavata]|uniref:RING-type E3 ubiquitin transferase n=1 Tax=Thraustotheca clavata TaxID=74557 RepID=A0A1W0A615_9STRA|nr:hypothetical protein THRCLA_02202 [Thraustotheca clavata]
MSVSIGLVIGGGLSIVLGRLCHSASDNATKSITAIEASQPLATLQPTPNASAYVNFTGRVRNINQPLYKSILAKKLDSQEHDAVRIRSKTYQRIEEIRPSGIVVHSENAIARSEIGGDVAVKCPNDNQVVLTHRNYFDMLYRKGEDEFEPAKDTSITIFGSSENRKTLGYRKEEHIIANGAVVSGVGLVESKLVYPSSGKPLLMWVLASPDSRRLLGRPSFVVYGDKDALLDQQEVLAHILGSIGTVCTVIGFAMVFGGGYLGYTKYKNNS